MVNTFFPRKIKFLFYSIGPVNSVVFIDLKKAFDTIDHQIILLKLKNYGIDENSLTLFHSYLTNRTQKCRVNDQLSNSVPVTCGVPKVQ